MDIWMQVNGNGITFDEVDIRESGMTIGEAIAAEIDEQLDYPKTRTIVITINV